MRRRRFLGIGAGIALLAGAVGGASSASIAVAQSGAQLLARGGHVSGVARAAAYGSPAIGLAPSATCSTPGGGNYKADCNSIGRATNETTIATNGAQFVAGANDYNSYNGQADFGYYTSADAKTWTDNGPLDLFAHDPR